MRVRHTLLGLLGLLLLLQAQPASAEIRIVFGGMNIKQGQTKTLRIYGQYVDWATDVMVSGSGVTASITDRMNCEENKTNTESNRCEGGLKIRVTAASNASPGERTFTIRYNVATVNIAQETFSNHVIRDGKITGVSPAQVRANQLVTLTLSGTNIGNASLNISPQPSSSRIVSNTETEVKVEVKWTSRVIQTTASISLHEGDMNWNSFGQVTVTIQPDLIKKQPLGQFPQ